MTNLPKTTALLRAPVHRRIMKSCLIIHVVLPFLALIGAASASEERQVELRPYSVEYQTKNWGITITLTRELKQGGNGVWNLSEGGGAMLQKVRQQSRFRTEGSQITPLGFTYSLRGPIKREREVQFPANGLPVRSLYKGEWYEFPPEPGMLDRLSMTEQFRLSLLHDPLAQELVVKRVDGRKVKEYRMQFVAEESLDTALGSIQTLHYQRIFDDDDDDRAFDIWLAPSWDFLMVRTVNLDDGDEVEAVIAGGSIGGTPLRDMN